MALKLTSGGISPTAGVRIKLIRATIDLPLTEATNVYVDPDSKNRIFTDTYALSDVTFLLTEKVIIEGVSASDASQWAFTKPTTDPISLADTFARTVNYNRTFTDGFTLDDATLINKDFVGAKGNVFGVSDVQVWGITKGLTDSATLTDTLQIDQSIGITDSAAVVDSALLHFNLAPSLDSVTLSDNIVITFTSASSVLNTTAFNIATLNS